MSSEWQYQWESYLASYEKYPGDEPYVQILVGRVVIPLLVEIVTLLKVIADE